MNGNVKLKKLWSLNPTEFRQIGLREACSNYHNYLTRYHADTYHQKESYSFDYDSNVKTFDEWLETEI